MTLSIATLLEKPLCFFRYLFKKGPTAITAEELPLGAELFGSDQMKQHGKILATAHELSDRLLPDRLLPRLSDNEAVLIDVCRPLTEAVVANRLIAPAEEWLLDNFYLIEEQIRTAKRHLPKGYTIELPRLSKGQSTGRPRVFDIALETISRGDGRVDPEGLTSFVAELARRLQGQGPALALPLTWIEQRLAGSGQAIEHLVQLEILPCFCLTNLLQGWTLT